MTERLLQYIWKFQYFNQNELTTSCGDALQILFEGQFNSNQGPDFLHARIGINGNLWVGNIELHINASDWFKHSHHSDSNYRNVILHVVWNDDIGDSIPGMQCLVLNGRVPGLLMKQYEAWLNSNHFIPCEKQIGLADGMVASSWLERLLVERLQRKSARINEMLLRNRFHWEEVLWWMMARSFGLVINADSFEDMAVKMPLNILLRHSSQIHQVEALLFGQAGLLHDRHKEKYPLMLWKEYSFLREKYGLERSHLPMQFLRMRPAGFPTVRIAQLAMLVHKSPEFFGKVVETEELNELAATLDVTANDYWHYHFQFDEETSYHPKKVGAQMVRNILLNSIIPYEYMYGEHRQEERYIAKAIKWTHELPAEQNTIVKEFARAGFVARDGGASQAMLELKTFYCEKKRCLECAIGNSILKKA